MESSKTGDSTSGPPTSPRRCKCPLTNFEPPTSTVTTAQLALEDSNIPTEGNAETNFKVERQEIAALLITNSRERVEYLQERLNRLKNWIKDAFGVEDPHQVQSTERKDSVEESVALLTASAGGIASSNNSKHSIPAVPPLRIKLVADESSSALSPPASMASIPRVGTGSKNLSRMMSRSSSGSTSSVVVGETTATSTAGGSAASGKAGAPATQIPVNVFWNYIEPFFKNIDDDDLVILEDALITGVTDKCADISSSATTSHFTSTLDPSPFIIPPLGKPYQTQWKERFGYRCSSSYSNHPTSFNATVTPSLDLKGLPQTPNLTTLRHRLLAMLVEPNTAICKEQTGGLVEHSIISQVDNQESHSHYCRRGSSDSSNNSRVPETEDAAEMMLLTFAADNCNTALLEDEKYSNEDVTKIDKVGGMSSLNPLLMEGLSKNSQFHLRVEERIKQELARVGLCTFVPSVDYQEDDEICQQIRELQVKLAESVCVNHYRKRTLSNRVRDQLAAQEFFTLLSDLDKQVEQGYAKRIRSAKRSGSSASSSKRKGSSIAGGGGTVFPLPPSPQGPSRSTPLGQQQQNGVSQLQSLVETRTRLLNEFVDLMPSLREHLGFTKDKLFVKEAEEAVISYVRDGGHWLTAAGVRTAQASDNSDVPLSAGQDFSTRPTSAQMVFPIL